jgi:hypothetical protein
MRLGMMVGTGISPVPGRPLPQLDSARVLDALGDEGWDRYPALSSTTCTPLLPQPDSARALGALGDGGWDLYFASRVFWMTFTPTGVRSRI